MGRRDQGAGKTLSALEAHVYANNQALRTYLFQSKLSHKRGNGFSDPIGQTNFSPLFDTR